MPNYLRQQGTGRIFIETPQLLMRKDMVPYDPITAETRIDALRRQYEDLLERKESGINKTDLPDEEIFQAKEMTELEEKIRKLKREESDALIAEKIDDENIKPPGQPETPKTHEELKAEERQNKIEEDLEIKKIRNFKKVNKIAEYALVEYGEKLNEKKDLKKLKAEVEALRIQRMFEGS